MTRVGGGLFKARITLLRSALSDPVTALVAKLIAIMTGVPVLLGSLAALRDLGRPNPTGALLVVILTVLFGAAGWVAIVAAVAMARGRFRNESRDR